MCQLWKSEFCSSRICCYFLFIFVPVYFFSEVLEPIVEVWILCCFWPLILCLVRLVLVHGLCVCGTPSTLNQGVDNAALAFNSWLHSLKVSQSWLLKVFHVFYEHVYNPTHVHLLSWFPQVCCSFLGSL